MSHFTLIQKQCWNGSSRRMENWMYFCRVIAWCSRFISNCRAQKKRKTANLRTSIEGDTAGIKRLHPTSPGLGIRSRHWFPAKKRRSARVLKIKISWAENKEASLVTVGRRLTQSTLDHDAMHPTILPANQRITSLIIWHTHVYEDHFQSERLVHHLLKKYWILSIRRVVKLNLMKCIPFRLTPFKPSLLYTGINYFGPVIVKMSG